MQGNHRHRAPTLECPGCHETVVCRYREFSPQVWSLLIHWREVEQSAVQEPMCGDCYRDLREVLIDRAEEMQDALQSPAPLVQRRATTIPVRQAS